MIELTTEHQVLPDASAFADVLSPDLTAAGDAGRRVGFRAVRLPPLRVRTGAVVASDGLIFDGRPFGQAVPDGDHDLTLALAVLGDDERVAFAQVRFGAGPVARWATATRPGQDVANLKAGEAFGYGVDSGTGCFGDPAAYAEAGGVEDLFQDLIDAAQAVYRHTRDWVTIRTDAGSVAVFSAGFGDGFYTSFFGYAADGGLVALVTDFGVVDWPGRPR